jgi:NADH dehydrogenase FAD-containing subunit
MAEHIAHTNVVVVGGGYAGVTAVNRLTKRDDVAVTLINARPNFVERIRLHQLVGGSDDAVVDYREVLAERIRLVIHTVTRIDASKRSVTLADGDNIGYDYLIYAAGSRNADPRVPGAAEFAYPIASYEHASMLRPVVDAAPADAAITVVGAGPTGIETATELAEQGRTVTLVSGRILGPYLHPHVRRSVAKRMAKLGVTVLAGPEAIVTSVTSDTVQLGNGRILPSAVTIWTAGFSVPELAARSGLSTDAVGRVLTDETLTSVDDTRIVAAGDSAAPSDMPFRMSCQAAGPLGAHATDTILSRIAGEQPAQVAMLFFGQCISLGRHDGVFQFAHKNDNPVRFYVGGRAGAALKALVCWATVKQLGIEARKPGLLSVPDWAADHSRRDALRTKVEV